MEMGMDNVDEQADDVYNGILGEIGLEYQVNDPVRIRVFLITYCIVKNQGCCANAEARGGKRGRTGRLGVKTGCS